MIYLDNNATTCIDPRVLEEMILFLSGPPGNPSSIHRYGQKARGRLIESTEIIADYLNVDAREVIFTSGATEALNMLIFGVLAKKKKGHIITSSMEHPSVLSPLKKCEGMGFEVSYLNPQKGEGAISPMQLEASLRPDTCLIILMAANNETGILTDLAGISAIAHAKQIPLIVDGVAWVGKGKIEIPPGVSAFCMSSHKIHGPMGVGVAFVRYPLKWNSLILGGPQQAGKRGGTENLQGIIGCAKAFQLLQEEQDFLVERMETLRDRFEDMILDFFPEAIVQGKHLRRICNTSNISFPGIDGETLLMRLDLAGVAASHGSACSSGAMEISHVLLNMGISAALARSSLRFSLSKFTTDEEIDLALEIIHRELDGLSNKTGFLCTTEP